MTNLKPGDRVVVPFNISCGHCWMCTAGLQSQCETTQVREQGKGAALFGYTKLYGQVPGGQAGKLRVPHADYGPIVVPDDGAHRAMMHLPDAVAAPMIEKAGFDRLAALHAAISSARRGGTVSVSGVYGGAVDPMPLMEIFDKQLTIRTGQCNVRRWVDDLMPLVTDPADPLGVLDLRTHRLPLESAPEAYKMFQKKEDGCIKVVLDPRLPAADGTR